MNALWFWEFPEPYTGPLPAIVRMMRTIDRDGLDPIPEIIRRLKGAR